MRLFISYAHEDVKAVQQLVDILRAGGYEVWFDTRLLPGQDWQTELLTAIHAADAFVYVLTPASIASEWCQWEFAEAVKLEKPVLPVLLRKSSLPAAISRYQYVDFSDGIDLLDVARLIGGLAKMSVMIPREQAPAVPPPKGLPAQAVLNNQTIVPRRAVSLLPDISYLLPPPFEWCTIPAGWVTLADASASGGTVGGKFHTRRFFLAKYPVTNAQYQVFLNAEDGYINPKWWDYSDAAKVWRAQQFAPVETGFPGDDLPRSNVTWYEAVAFCRWLTARTLLTFNPPVRAAGRGTLKPPLNPRALWDRGQERVGWRITLPTELQWQRAAQGDDRRAYPWGTKFDRRRANTGENGLKKVTPVAQYANGASLYAVLDLSGNTWEWCLNEWGTDNLALAGAQERAARGGSWGDDQQAATCDYRHRLPPDSSSDQVGFRVCVDFDG